MSTVKVTVEWRRGVNGDQGTFTFFPNPFITRPTPGKRTARLIVPLLDGAIVQELGVNERTIELKGVLFNKTNSWDDMETLRNNLINGIQVGPGQLHILSPTRHLRYDGQIATDGIQFQEQTHGNIQDYNITIKIPNTLEQNV
ncbi:MAG: hypothetical protein E2O29_01940 [Deltaproteobacteria bacterium]|nr:MAG: hypothetical protein E2O29_01940 [Deltaproteobacteria bacterium]